MDSPAAVARDSFDDRTGLRSPGLNEPSVEAYYYADPQSADAAGDRPQGHLHVSRPTQTPAAGSLGNDEPVGGTPKRILDIIVASLALVLLAPLLVFVAAMILFTLKRPVLFTQTRVGHGGRTFKCYKFRTMVPDANKVLSSYLSANPDAAREWQTTQKLAHDPRVTFVGHLLRKSSIDELPQLFNVLRGDMSCVGPRPILQDELKRYGAAKDDYLRARPGMTGLWQVSGRNALSYDARVSLDSQYVQTWSLMRDIEILAKTVPAVVRFGETA